MRVYLDNNLISYLLALREERARQDFEKREAHAISKLLNREDVTALCSDESLAEIEKTPNADKQMRLATLYSKLKQGRAIVRNAQVTWDDGVTRWDSPDARWDHPYDDADRQRLEGFFRKKGIFDDFDIRYLANAMLPENRIDVFLTADKRTIWKFREELRQLFGVRVALPSELLDELEPGAGSAAL
jgi:hypothetical protein